jgi:hypothetical protein
VRVSNLTNARRRRSHHTFFVACGACDASRVRASQQLRTSGARCAERVARARVDVRMRDIHHFARALSYPPSRVARTRAHASARHDHTSIGTTVECKIEKRVTPNATTSKNVCRCVDVNFVRPRDVEMLDVPT